MLHLSILIFNLRDVNVQKKHIINEIVCFISTLTTDTKLTRIVSGFNNYYTISFLKKASFKLDFFFLDHMIMTVKMMHSGYFNAVSVMDTVPVEYDTRTVFFFS